MESDITSPRDAEGLISRLMRFTPEQDDKIRTAAALEGCSQAEIVRRLVDTLGRPVAIPPAEPDPAPPTDLAGLREEVAKIEGKSRFKMPGVGSDKCKHPVGRRLAGVCMICDEKVGK